MFLFIYRKWWLYIPAKTIFILVSDLVFCLLLLIGKQATKVPAFSSGVGIYTLLCFNFLQLGAPQYLLKPELFSPLKSLTRSSRILNPTLEPARARLYLGGEGEKSGQHRPAAADYRNGLALNTTGG